MKHRFISEQSKMLGAKRINQSYEMEDNMTIVLEQENLKIMPCTQAMAQAITADHKEKLSKLLNANLSPTWPSEDTKDIASFYGQQLVSDPSLFGWGMWILIHKEKNMVIGDVGFKGKPDERGSVEVGYGIVPAFRNQGHATDAAQLLIDWALESEEVSCIKAECLRENLPSIKVLQKLGMQRISQEGDLQRWERKK